MRVNVEPRRRIGNAHQVQQVDGPLTASLLIAALMNFDRFHNLVADGIARIEAGHRILEDHRHFRPHQLTPLFFRDALQVAAIELQFVRHHPAGIVNQAHNRQRTDGFTGTGLPHNTDHFTLLHAIADAVYGAERRVLIAEMHR